MEYSTLLNELNAVRDEKFIPFQEKMINTRQKILGVRTPQMRAIAKKYKAEWESIVTFPDEFYEVTFIKMDVVSRLPYDKFITQVENCVSVMDNWAVCDTFKAGCIKTRRDEFLPVLLSFMGKGEFYERYILVTFLNFYMEEKYLPTIFVAVERTDLSKYYTHMGAAWLIAEVLIKCHESGKAYLKEKRLPTKTHNKAIQKAKESFRLTKAQKEELSSLICK